MSLNDVFVLSYDGAVVQSGKLRARQSIRLAVETWPPLQELVTSLDDRTNKVRCDPYPSWLVQKLTRLSPVVRDVCDGALLARLLLEEQQLDRGQSNGSRGKYGSKYHPNASLLKEEEPVRRKNPRQSRPLTVGEIAANWGGGAELRETTRLKYAICGTTTTAKGNDNPPKERLDPMPVLRSNARRMFTASANRAAEETDDDLPSLHPLMKEILSCRGVNDDGGDHDILVMVEEEDEKGPLWQEAQAVLSGYSHVTVVATANPVVVLSNLLDQQEDQQVIVIHRSLEVLQELARNLLNQQYGQMPLLSLRLPTWDSTFVTADQCLEAEMDPHLRLVTEEEVVECMTARVIPSPAPKRE